MPWDEGCQRAVAIAMDEDRSAPDLFKEYVEYLQHSDMSGMTLAAYSRVTSDGQHIHRNTVNLCGGTIAPQFSVSKRYITSEIFLLPLAHLP